MTVVAGKRRRSAGDGEVQRLNCYISPESYNRLMVNAVMERTSPGLLLERLIIDHCKAWSLPAGNKTKKGARAKPDETTDRPDDGADVSQESAAA